jgi:hypothetical protein
MCKRADLNNLFDLGTFRKMALCQLEIWGPNVFCEFFVVICGFAMFNHLGGLKTSASPQIHFLILTNVLALIQVCTKKFSF